MASKFRFLDLKIWQLAIEIADDLGRKKLYRFAEQLRASGMSMSNNIAEGSGSSSKRSLRIFLILPADPPSKMLTFLLF